MGAIRLEFGYYCESAIVPILIKLEFLCDRYRVSVMIRSFQIQYVKSYPKLTIQTQINCARTSKINTVFDDD